MNQAELEGLRELIKEQGVHPLIIKCVLEQLDDRESFTIPNNIRIARIHGTMCGDDKCKTCGQIDAGQTGEYPCKTCGIPTLHDESYANPSGGSNHDSHESFVVPDNIKIRDTYDSNWGDCLGICFNKTQLLYYDSINKIWFVTNILNSVSDKKFKCVPCKFEELKPGDTAYNQIKYDPEPKLNKETEERLISYCTKRDKENLSCYCKILPNKQHCFVVNEEGVSVGKNYASFDWWRVVPQ